MTTIDIIIGTLQFIFAVAAFTLAVWIPVSRRERR